MMSIDLALLLFLMKSLSPKSWNSALLCEVKGINLTLDFDPYIIYILLIEW